MLGVHNRRYVNLALPHSYGQQKRNKLRNTSDSLAITCFIHARPAIASVVVVAIVPSPVEQVVASAATEFIVPFFTEEPVVAVTAAELIVPFDSRSAGTARLPGGDLPLSPSMPDSVLVPLLPASQRLRPVGVVLLSVILLRYR